MRDITTNSRNWILIDQQSSGLIEVHRVKEDVYIVSVGENCSALLDHSEYCDIILRNDMVQYFGEF